MHRITYICVKCMRARARAHTHTHTHTCCVCVRARAHTHTHTHTGQKGDGMHEVAIVQQNAHTHRPTRSLSLETSFGMYPPPTCILLLLTCSYTPANQVSLYLPPSLPPSSQVHPHAPMHPPFFPFFCVYMHMHLPVLSHTLSVSLSLSLSLSFACTRARALYMCIHVGMYTCTCDIS